MITAVSLICVSRNLYKYGIHKFLFVDQYSGKGERFQNDYVRLTKIFKHLISLDVEDSKDVKSGYTITFNFSPNPYFEDTKLVKSYTFNDEGTTDITGTNIKWKEAMDISNGANPEKKGAKRPANEERMNGLTGRKMQKIFRALGPDPVRNDAHSLVEYCCFRYLSRDSSDFHPSLKVSTVMDFVLAEFYKACIYTVPKHIRPLNDFVQDGSYSQQEMGKV